MQLSFAWYLIKNNITGYNRCYIQLSITAGPVSISAWCIQFRLNFDWFNFYFLKNSKTMLALYNFRLLAVSFRYNSGTEPFENIIFFYILSPLIFVTFSGIENSAPLSKEVPLQSSVTKMRNLGFTIFFLVIKVLK